MTLARGLIAGLLAMQSTIVWGGRVPAQFTAGMEALTRGD